MGRSTKREPARTGRGRVRAAFRVGAAVAALALFGCFDPGAGETPPDAQLYFPVGLALSESGKYLFVVNSDFDLRYNAGTVQALDVTAIEAHAHACEIPPGSSATSPAAKDCDISDASQFVRGAVRIGAFGADILGVPRYTGDGDPLDATHGRLLVPVRGDATVTFIDYDETSTGLILGCYRGAKEGDGAPGGRAATACDVPWRVGTNPSQNSRQLTLEGEPFSIAAPSYWGAIPRPDPDPTKPTPPIPEPRRSGGIATVIHQDTGDVSLYVGTVKPSQTLGDLPQARLSFTLGGLPAGGTSITALDIPETPFTPRFLVTNRSQSNVYVLSYFGDPGTTDRAALFISDIVPIPTNSAGYDTRGALVDPPTKDEPVTRPIRVFLTNRTPASLVVGEIDPDSKKLHFYENVPLPLGPSRITRAELPRLDPDGTTRLHTLLLIASFDQRQIVTYDPDLRRIGNVVRVGRGPYALAIDNVNKLGFVANFTESTVQVIELDPANTRYFQEPIYTVGTPLKPI